MKKTILIAVISFMLAATYLLAPCVSFGAEIDDFDINICWGDSEQNLPSGYIIARVQDDAVNTIKMQANLEYRGDGSITYGPGEISFELDGVSLPHIELSSIACKEWNYELIKKDVNYKEGLSANVIDKIRFTNKEQISSSFTSSVQMVYMVPTKTTLIPLSYQQDHIKGVLNIDDKSKTSNELSFCFSHPKNVISATMQGAEPLSPGDGTDNKAWAKICGKLPSDPEDYIFVKSMISTKYNMNIMCDTRGILEFEKGSGEYMCIIENDDYSDFRDENDKSLRYDVEAMGDLNKIYYLYMAFPRSKYQALRQYEQKLSIYTRADKVENDDDFELVDSKSIMIDFSHFNYVFSGSLYSLALQNTSTYISAGNMENAYSNDYLLTYDNLKTDIFAADIGTSRDINLEYDNIYYLFENGSYRKAGEEEKHFQALANYSGLPDGCKSLEVFGKTDGGWKSLGQLTGDLTTSQVNKMKSQINSVRCSAVRYLFKGCTGEFSSGTTYPMVASTLDKTHDTGYPVKALYLARLQVVVGETDKASVRQQAVTNIDGLDEEIARLDYSQFGEYKFRSSYAEDVVKSANDAVSGLNILSTWQSNGDKTQVLLSNGSRLYDYSHGTQLNGIETRLTLPKGVRVSSLAFVSDYAGALSRLYFSGTNERVPVDYLKKHTRTYYERDETGNDVFVVINDFSQETVATNYTSSTNNPLFDFTLEVDNELFDMLGLSGTTGKFKINCVWNLKGEAIKASAQKNFTLPSIAASTYQGVELTVRTVEEYVKPEAVVAKGGEYEYKLRLGSGSGKDKYMVFYGNLESAGPEAASCWQGIFNGIDVSAMKELGAEPVIYYSLNKNQVHNISANGWISSDKWTFPLMNVKSFAIDFGDYVLAPNKPAIAYIKMTAPEEADAGSFAYNKFSTSYRSYPAALSDDKLTYDNAQENIKNLFSNVTRVAFGAPANSDDELVIKKRISVSDYYKGHGDLTSIFKVSDGSNEWYGSVSFNEDDIKSGVLEKQIRLTLPMGEYEVEEVSVSRSGSVKGPITGNVMWKIGDTSEAQVVLNDETKDSDESVTFVGKKNKWNAFSHNDLIINTLLKQ
ncbi:MAG: hypothetical protein PUB09_06960 [Firmicutes bacterium]|nr:hypothetical protein [Bacillota bacterium]